MKQIIIVAGGSPKYWPEMSSYKKNETFWVGVDRGAWFLLENGITPDYAVGDFDSLSVEEFKTISEVVSEVVKAPREKDETDTQLGLKIAMSESDDCPIILIGATGGRMDHLMANFWLMLEPRFQEISQRFMIKDNQNSITFYQSGSHVVEKEGDKDYLGFLCVTPVADLTLRGVKYPLNNYQAAYPISFASNEFIEGYANFEFSSGVVVVVQSKDK